MKGTVRFIKRLFVAIIGGTIVAIGICMIALPGPAILVIPAGLAILATEFVWARVWLDKAKSMVQKTGQQKQPKPVVAAPAKQG